VLGLSALFNGQRALGQLWGSRDEAAAMAAAEAARRGCGLGRGSVREGLAWLVRRMKILILLHIPDLNPRHTPFWSARPTTAPAIQEPD